MTEKSISVYKRLGEFYCVPRCGGITIPPVRSLLDSTSHRQKGEMALAALDDCLPKGSVSMPSDWDRYMRPIYAVFEVSDHEKFMIACFCVSVKLTMTELELSPRRNDPTFGNFVALPVEVVRRIPASSSPDEIGEAIEWAFTHATIDPSPPDEPGEHEDDE